MSLTKKLIVFSALLLAIAVSVKVASATEDFYGDGYWMQWQATQEATGNAHNSVIGHYRLKDSSSADNSYSKLSTGSPYQPIIADLNSDGTMDIVTSQASLLKVYKTNNNALVLQDEISAGTQSTHIAAINTTNGTFLVYPSGDSLGVYEFNSSDKLRLWTLVNLSSHNVSIIRPVIKCTNYESAHDRCYVIGENASGAESEKYRVVEYIFHTNSVASWPVAWGPDKMALGDLEHNGILDVVVSGGTDVCAYTEAGTERWCKNIPAYTNYGLAIYNMDGQGYQEIVMTRVSGGSTVNAVAYDSDGNTVANDDFHPWGVAGAKVSNPVFALTTDNKAFRSGSRQACMYSMNTGSNMGQVWCFNISGLTFLDDYNSGLFTDYWDYDEQMVTADMNNDGYSDLVTRYGIRDLRSGNVSNWTTLPSGYAAVGDINDDGSADVVFTDTSSIWAFFSDFSNGPPSIVSGEGFRILPFDKDQVCPNTTLTFSMVEDDEYSNDVEADEERIISDCGNTSLYLANGSFSGAGPSVQCFFGGVGTYQVRLWLEDDHNPGDESAMDTEQVVVISGVPGESCNVPAPTSQADGTEGEEGGLADDDEITSSDEIAYVVDTLTGQEPLIEGIMVIIFSLVLVFGLAKVGVSSPFIYAISLFMTWIVCSVVGIMPWLYTILFGFVSVALGALAFVIGRGE